MLAWSPDGSRLVTGSEDGTAQVLQIDNDGIRHVLTFSSEDMRGGITGVAFSPDGAQVMTGAAAITAVNIWDAAPTGGGEWANVQGVPPEAWYDGADFTPDGRNVLVAQRDGTVLIADAVTGERRSTLEALDGGVIGSLDLSPDGQLLATASVDGSIHVRDAITGELRFSIPSASGWWPGRLEWSDDGTWLAAVANSDEVGSKVVIVDRSGAEVAKVAESPDRFVTSVSFGADSMLATTTLGIEINDPAAMRTTIWDWERGEVVSTVDPGSALAAFDPAGQRIATAGSGDGTADIWDVQSGDKVATIAAPAEIVDVVFGPDGTTVATGHKDGTARIWDADSGIQRLALGGLAGIVEHVVFGPDGSTLASVASDGVVRVWALDLDDLIGIAQDRLTRGFSDDECRQYLHLDRCPNG